MIRILYVSSASNKGGAENSLLLLVEKLDRDVFLPIVACPRAGDFVRELEKIGIKKALYNVRPFKPISRKIGRVKILDPLAAVIDLVLFMVAVSKLIKLIKRERIDVIHSNDLMADIYGGIAARIRRKPVIWHLRDVLSKGVRRRFFSCLASRIPDRLIVVSRGTARALSSYSHNVSVIYNGVDLDRFSTRLDGRQIKGELGLGGKTRVVGMVGRITREKGFETFLMTAERICTRVEDVAFMIVGGPKDETQARLFQELTILRNTLGLERKVHFLGERDDMPELYACMDVLLLPSLREAFPRSILEAQACGVPVVATNVGGVGEIIVDGVNGFLVNDWKDYGAFATKTVFILENHKLRNEMEKNGAKKVRESFDINRIVKIFENMYKGICTGLLPADSNIL